MRIDMELGSRSYPILVERGCLNRLGSLANLQRNILVVTDTGVPKPLVEAALAQCPQGHLITLPQGEGSKSLIGDLAGFAAGCYMRGVDFINCPTTTLSQVDSSIGGKTAVNLGGSKNQVGVFHQPRLVLVDPDTLHTLPPRHFAAGLAEALKAGLIGDPQLFALLEQGDLQAHLEEILCRSLLVKKALVEQDEREAGPRAALNLGHTIGHAIESEEGLGGLYHGECVGLGMLPMILDPQLKQRTIAVLEGLGLPHTIRYDGAAIFRRLCHDKKADSGYVTLVRVPALGQYRLDRTPLSALPAIIGEGIG